VTPGEHRQAVHPAVITVQFATPGGGSFTAICDSDKGTCDIFYSDVRVIFDFGSKKATMIRPK
jgi:hypothetical protein